MKTVGLKLLSSLVHSGDIESYLKLRLDEAIFLKSEVDIHTYVKDHVLKYSVLPSVDIVNEYISADGFTLPVTDDTPEYYYDEVIDRHVTNTMKKSIAKAKSDLITLEPKEVLGELINSFITLSMENNSNDIVCFNDAGKILHKDYVDKIKSACDTSIKLGWPYLDDMMQGAQPGDLISLIGRPGEGKTFQMLYAAHNAWLEQKKNVLFVSMEMLPIPIMQRVAAIQAKYNLTALKTVPMTTKGYDKVFGELLKIEDHPSKFWIVDGNLTATIDDIWAIVRQLNPDAVFVDGAYLVKVQDKRLNKWDRIGYVAEELKSKVATNLKVPVFASYQFNKQMLKKKEMTEVGLDDIYGSDVIGQVSSVVLGVFDDPSVESLISKRITLLKGRNGEIGSFEIHWDFLNMDFSEIIELKNEGLKYA